MVKINGNAFLNRITLLRRQQNEVHTAASEVANAMRKLAAKQKKANGKDTSAVGKPRA